MFNPAPRPTNDPGGRAPGNPLLTVVISLCLLGALWLFINREAVLAQRPQEDGAVALTTEPWPTPPPTFTPITMQRAAPLPTPIPLPRWEEQRELSVGTFTLTSVQEAEVEAGRQFSLDKMALIQVTYKVEMYVDLSGLEQGAVQRDGNVITVAIPPPIWKRPQYTGLNALEREHVSKLFPSGPPVGVIGKGEADIVRQLETNPGLRRLAYDAARTQMAELLTDLGFRHVTVVVSQ